MRIRLALPATCCPLVSWFQARAQSTVTKVRSHYLLRPSAGLFLGLIGLMTGFIASGYCQDRAASAMGATELTAPSGWAPTGNLNTPRGNHTATLLPSGKVLVAGGWADPYTPTNSAELYDIATGTWSVTGSLGSAFADSTATLLPDGKVLLVGTAKVGAEFILSSELYDPATGTWNPNTTPPAFADAAALLPDGTVLMVWYTFNTSATYGTNIAAFAHRYESATGLWLPAAKPNSVHSDSTATLLQNGRVLVVGGRSEAESPDSGWWANDPEPTRAEVYEVNSDSWTEVGPAVFIGLHTATLLANGKVLLAGGVMAPFGPEPLNAVTRLYDPAAETVSNTGNLTVSRLCCHTATLLPNGKVLVAGGVGSIAGRSAELYDPDTGTWARTSSLNTGRHGHTATLLPNGRVLVAGGGSTSYEGSLKSAEIYDPEDSANQPPVNALPAGEITSPAVGALYRAGQTITYAGTATDAEDGNLPASAFTWRVDFYHDDGTLHSHPFIVARSGAKGGSFVIPKSGETSPNVFYRISLTVTDSGGLTHTSFHDVLPRTSTITLATDPPGLSLTLDGQPYIGPVVGVAGMIRSIGAPTPQVVGGVKYAFRRWSDGGRATHDVTIPTTNTTYKAKFSRTPASWWTR